MITWDENKRRKNIKDHGIDFAELNDVFAHFMDTEPQIGYEHRLKSLCWFKDRVVVMIWTEQNHNTRIISCRNASKYEIRIYAQRATF